MRFNVPPLLVRDPLHVTEEIRSLSQGLLLLMREVTQPTSRTFDCAMLRRPLVPRRAIFVFFDENSEERVIVQP